jgi:hypothetical protein
VACFADRFTHDENCLMAVDVDGFCREIERLAVEPDLRDRLSLQARIFAEARSLDQVGTTLRTIYERAFHAGTPAGVPSA